MYFGFIQIASSKEREEDEFSSYFRMKSIIVALVIILVGFGASHLMDILYVFEVSQWIFNVSVPIIIAAFLIFYICYFFYSRFRTRTQLKFNF